MSFLSLVSFNMSSLLFWIICTPIVSSLAHHHGHCLFLSLNRTSRYSFLKLQIGANELISLLFFLEGIKEKKIGHYQ